MCRALIPVTPSTASPIHMSLGISIAVKAAHMVQQLAGLLKLVVHHPQVLEAMLEVSCASFLLFAWTELLTSQRLAVRFEEVINVLP